VLVLDLKKIFKLGRSEKEKAIAEKAPDEKSVNEPIMEICNQEEQILTKENIKLGLKATSKTEAIKLAGRLLVEGGYVDESYIEAMLQREESLSTYIGNGVAIPHGVNAAKASIKKTGITVLQFPEGVDFGEGTANLVIGIAGVGKEHLSILSNLATIMGDEEVAEEMKTTNNIEYVHGLFTDGIKM
jgi:PTS system mannitol-specific IIC component